MGHKSWGQLGLFAKATVVFAAFVQIGLLVAALVDLNRRSAERVRGPKPMWVPVAFVNFAGPIAYFLIGRRR